MHRAVHALLTAQPQDAAGGVRGYCGKVLGNAAVVVGAHLLVGRCRVVVGQLKIARSQFLARMTLMMTVMTRAFQGVGMSWTTQRY